MLRSQPTSHYIVRVDHDFDELSLYVAVRDVRSDQEPLALLQSQYIHQKYEQNSDVSISKLLNNFAKDLLMD
jgi:hypothetical protein